MILFPNCKINLGLHILHKRSDGYHDLETVFCPVPLRDALEVVTGSNGVELSLTGIPVAGDAADNLCVKAYALLKQDFPELPSVVVHLHKVIPSGAGLGGGSADGAFMLRLLNEKFQLGISIEQLLQYALELGSDCPFFILNKPALANGRGERLQPVDLDLSAWSFMLVHPGVHINTGWAFSQITPTVSAQSIQEILQQPITSWPSLLINDFEAPVCQHYPALQQIKENLYAAGALYASMTGSGSCFYGIFPKHQVPSIVWPTTYKVYVLK